MSRGAFVSVEALEDAVANAQHLVLGESHDNVDHHALEAELTGRFLAAHESAAVGFEMLDEADRPALQPPPADAEALARAVRWDESGWPEFAQYRPVFEVVLAQDARVVAAHPSRDRVRASMAGLPEAEARALHLDRPLAPAAREQLEREIRDSHCGHAPAAMLEGMVRAQSFKDAFMARSLVQAGVPSVLVTGRGHARKDRAVPHYLALFGATGVVSIAFIEVEDGKTAVANYELAPYDFAIFTPRVSDEDPCARFAEQLEKMRAQPER